MPNREQIELMLPVGSWESLAAAHQAGADAVYFGVEGLNMRSASSVNFSLTDLRKIVEYCTKHGLKSYLTLNTVVYDKELDYMHQVLDAAAEAGVSAVIAADQAAIVAARKRGLEVHLSTQLNISNIEAVKFYAAYADVVVLARELELPAVRKIYDEIERQQVKGPSGELIRIEMFVHGALCMATSGKCYMSLHEAWKSANRGSCRQLCRRRYRLTDVETGGELEVDNEFIMSPKDLCTIDFLDAMIDAGVRVLKIEGRARDGWYVRTVGAAYRAAIDAICSGTYSADEAAKQKEELRRVFNREFWGGYYLGHPLGEWTKAYGSSATERKVYVGKVTNYYKKLGVAELTLEAEPLEKGQKLLALGATTGAIEFTCPDIYLNDAPETAAAKGAVVAVQTPELLHRGDKLFRLDPAQ